MALIEGSYPVDRPGVIAHYRDYLPVTENTPLFSLGEGFTPLIHARWLGDELGLEQLYLKNEGQNPTGSFKDRGMVMAVAKAIEENAEAIVCASTGNTAASAAAYGALAGMQVIVVIPRGNIAHGKLAQSLHYGARVVAVDGNFDDALRIIREITQRRRVTLVNSVNPMRLEGQKTGAFEVCDGLRRSPDYLAIPVGNAGNISAYWAGFKQYRERGRRHRSRQRRGDYRRLQADLAPRRHLLRACFGSQCGRRDQAGQGWSAGDGGLHRVRPHGLRPQGPGHRHRPRCRCPGDGGHHRVG